MSLKIVLPARVILESQDGVIRFDHPLTCFRCNRTPAEFYETHRLKMRAGLRHKGAGAAALRALGRGILRAAPWLMKTLSVAGTAAMFLVGGGILTHGVPALHHAIEGAAEAAAGLPAPCGMLSLGRLAFCARIAMARTLSRWSGNRACPRTEVAHTAGVLPPTMERYIRN